MVLPMGGLGGGGPPSRYCLEVALPRLKIVLVAILVAAILRLISQFEVERVILDGIFDMFTPLLGYCLFKYQHAMASCLCSFMMMAILNAVNDVISIFIRFSEYGSLAFCADGNVHPIGDAIIRCNAFQPIYTCTLMTITVLQLYASVLGYKMLKSTTQGADNLLGGEVPAGGQFGMNDMGGGNGGGGPQGPVGPGAPRAPGFTAFAGEGQRLGQL